MASPRYSACMTDLSTPSPLEQAPVCRPAPFWRRVALALAVVAIIGVWPDQSVEAVRFAAGNLLAIAPAMLAALLFTALIAASGASELIARSFEGREIVAIGVASLVGALSPVCGITVFPLVAGLLAAGVPLAPIMAFWLASPVTDPGMLAITAAMLGLPFAIGKTVAAFAAGLIGGGVTLAATQAGMFKHAVKTNRLAAAMAAPGCGCDGPDGVSWRVWSTPARRSAFLSAGYETGRLMLIWLSVAFLAEYFLRRHVPTEWVAGLVGAESDYAVVIAATIGAPIYLEGYASLPLLRGLIEAGMREDAAMAFLVAGGITSVWAAIPVWSLVRWPLFALYLALAVVSSMVAGFGYGVYLAL